MAKKEKRISINKLESMVMPRDISVPLDGVDGVEITIHRTLPLSDVLQFVANVVSACIDIEAGTYTPEVIPFAIKANILTIYANFNLPSSVEKQYDLIYNTSAISQVMGYIDMVQYGEIINAIEDKIKHELDVISNAVTKQIADIASQMEEFSNKSQLLFSEIDNQDIASLMKNLSHLDSIDESALVHAFLDAQKADYENPVSQTTDNEGSGKIMAFPQKDK